MFLFLVILSLNHCEGQENVHSSDLERISDAEVAPAGRFPYMCSIRKRGTGAHVCGGILIDNDWMMTAAHCLDPTKKRSAGMTPFVYCNITQRNDQDDFKRFAAERCYLHHLWSGDVRDGADIALCQFDRSADLLIPDLANIGEAFTKDNVFSILGWGRTSDSSPLANTLQIGSRVGYVSQFVCNRVPELAGHIKASMICAGRGSQDTCKGDSGGPLLIAHNPVSTTQVDNPLLDLIVGITSFGASSCEAEAPGVYTRVSCYRAWIDCIMKGMGEACSVHFPCENSSSLCSGFPRSSSFDETEALEKIKIALVSDESETVKKILCDGLNIDIVFGTNKNSLLTKAAQHDAIESTKVLLQHGAKMEFKNGFGQSALSRTAAFGSARVAQFLIDRAANIETRENVGWTPLSNAAFYNYLQVARILLESGANVESKNNEGWTPLHILTQKNRVDMAKELVSRGANIEARSNTGDTPLILAAYFGSSEVVQFLLEKNAIVDATNNAGGTALYWAATSGRVSIVGILIHNGASKSATDNDGKTPFDVICTDENLDEPCKDDVVITLRQLLG